ncbi:nuclease-related domain-containing protein [Danxiaibacter flavus]|uniref:Nuclease-related domain-containing protein n=1 Tax=Danxiaibacter flavus TaxID=3049108 RepID=A0ABV3ZQ00_9BACT|nr:nuclease-related domain-containing protein [Chitinophagaceae bacterium DXS]
MCRVYNPVGCLTTVKSHLNQNNITEFNSLNEVIAFQRSYAASRQCIISNAEIAIEKEKNQIISDNLRLKISIKSAKDAAEKALQEQIEYLKLRLESLMSLTHRNTLRKITNYFRIAFLKKKIRRYELILPFRVFQSVQQLMKIHQDNESRYNYITTRFQDAVIENCAHELSMLERKKALIDEVNSSIYGAIGEQKVVKELECLSDEYVLINDFCMSFNPPIYNRNENDHIRSIQVDHLLIAPSGVFLIETKNWSEQSLNNSNMRSPVSQVKRTGFALFTILNSGTARSGLSQHHWGKRKIPLKNIVVSINQKPLGEFQYVKVLALNQLLGYIRHFPPTFTRRETEEIANELLSLSGSEKR